MPQKRKKLESKFNRETKICKSCFLKMLFDLILNAKVQEKKIQVSFYIISRFRMRSLLLFWHIHTKSRWISWRKIKGKEKNLLLIAQTDFSKNLEIVNEIQASWHFDNILMNFLGLYAKYTEKKKAKITTFRASNLITARKCNYCSIIVAIAAIVLLWR